MIAGMAIVASGLAASSLALLLIGAVVAGMGTGLAFRSGLAALNAEAPADRRGEINSTYFFVAYLALSLPIIGVGVASEAVGLRTAGLVFSGCVALLALLVLISLGRRVNSERPGQPPDTPRNEAMADSTGNR
jgi:MFS family permease